MDKKSIDTIPVKIKAELGDQIMHLAFGEEDKNIRLAFQFDGILDEVLFKKAIEITLPQEPMINYYYEEGWRNSYWKKDRKVGISEIFSLCEAQEDPKSEVHKFLVQKADPYHAPQVKIKIFRYNNNDSLYMIVPHAVTDGMGIVIFASKLSENYRKLQKDINHLPNPGVKYDRSNRIILKKYRFGEKIKALFDRSMIDETKRLKEFNYVFPWDKANTKYPYIYLHSIHPEKVRLLDRYRKNIGCTIDDIILSAYFRTFYNMNPNIDCKTRVVNVAVNLRKYLNAGTADCFCNYATILNIILQNDIDLPFEDTLNEVRKIKETKHLYSPVSENSKIPGFSGVLLFSLISKMLSYSSMKKKFSKKSDLDRIPFLSDVGRLDKANISFGDLQVKNAYFIGSFPNNPGFRLTCSRYNDTINLTIAFNGNENDKAQVKAFMERFEKELPV